LGARRGTRCDLSPVAFLFASLSSKILELHLSEKERERERGKNSREKARGVLFATHPSFSPFYQNCLAYDGQAVVSLHPASIGPGGGPVVHGNTTWDWNGVRTDSGVEWLAHDPVRRAANASIAPRARVRESRRQQ
jgi:hypothetical protein